MSAVASSPFPGLLQSACMAKTGLGQDCLKEIQYTSLDLNIVFCGCSLGASTKWGVAGGYEREDLLCGGCLVVESPSLERFAWKCLYGLFCTRYFHLKTFQSFVEPLYRCHVLLLILPWFYFVAGLVLLLEFVFIMHVDFFFTCKLLRDYLLLGSV